MIALENRSDWNIDAIHWKCYSNPVLTGRCWLIFGPATISSNFKLNSLSLPFSLKHTLVNGFTLSLTYTEAHARFYYTQPRHALRSFHTCLSLMLSQRQRQTYHRTTCLRPLFLSCLLAFSVFWQPTPFLLSLPLSVALEPNYPQRT